MNVRGELFCLLIFRSSKWDIVRHNLIHIWIIDTDILACTQVFFFLSFKVTMIYNLQHNGTREKEGKTRKDFWTSSYIVLNMGLFIWILIFFFLNK